MKFSAVLFLLLLSELDAARILGMFLAPFKSHFAFNDAIMRSLVAAGHEVTVVGPFPPTEQIANYTVINWDSAGHATSGNELMNDHSDVHFLNLVKRGSEFQGELARAALKTDEIQGILNSGEKKYDLFFVEMIPMYQCVLPIAAKLNIPVIGTMGIRYNLLADLDIGNPHNPAVVPFIDSYLSKTMTFEQRLRSSLCYVLTMLVELLVYQPKVKEVQREHFSDFELSFDKKPELVFYNNHFSLLPRPTNPNGIEISGIHVKPVKPLPEEIDKFITEAEHGVIFVSFGSIVRLSPQVLTMFVEAFSALPQRVLWKHDERMEQLSQNVLMSNWWPQRDILAHHNVRAFLTHCGISGLYEAIDAATPLVMFPFFGDQLSNAAILEEHKVGVVVDWKTINTEKLLTALKLIINEPRYKEKMVALSRAFKDRPMSPQQTVVYWTEYILRHNGSSHLQSPSLDMPLYQYFLLDILIFTIIAVIFLMLSIYFIFINLLRRFSKIPSRSEENKNKRE